MTYGLAWSVLSHCCNFILISPDFLTSEQANLFPPQALCICCSSCLECFQVKYHVLREAFLDPPTPTGVQHSFISVTALLLSKTTVFTYLLTCFFSISCTRTFHHKGRDSIYPPLYSQVLEWCLLQLPPPLKSQHSSTVVRALQPPPLDVGHYSLHKSHFCSWNCSLQPLPETILHGTGRVNLIGWAEVTCQCDIKTSL